MTSKLALPLTAALAALSACSQEPPKPAVSSAPAPAAETPFRPTATIQEIMDSMVDPSADYVWGSIGFVATKKGVEDKTPHTDKEWATVRHNAMTVVEATNLLVMDGRKVAVTGRSLDEEEKGGIEDPAEIQKAIDANRAAFIRLAHGLHDAGMEMLKAIDAKDLQAMDAAGEKLDAACEACHRTFWYPNAVEPIQTLEPPK